MQKCKLYRRKPTGHYCGNCIYYNNWAKTYVEKSEYIKACCAYWHVAHHSRNIARRPSCQAYIDRCKPIQLTLFN